MFTFCPLQGALSEAHASQSLLELDGGIKLLVGVGWDESFDLDKLKELERHVPTISLILLTHATIPHLAAYAHCCKTIPLFTRIPVYATRPVIDLGRTLLQDLYASSPAAATTVPHNSLSESSTISSSSAAHDFLLQAPTPDEIARYFAAVQALKYSQPHQPLGSPFSPPLNGLTITAYNAGHTLGGTIWHIQHGLESIVYAVDWNQAKENVFAGAAWLGGAGGGGADVIEQLRKPTALVCSTRGAGKMAQAGGRAKRDEQLLDMIKAGIGKGGTVLIPIDSSARVLEVAYLLEHAWRTDNAEFGSGLRSAKLYLAGRNMASTMRYARSMLEWMDEAIVREFEAVADGQRKSNGDGGRKEAGPFDFRHMRLVDRKTQIEKLFGPEASDISGPKVIVASDSSIDWGFSRDILQSLAQDSKNLVILTEKPGLCKEDRPSISRTLWEWWRDRKDGVSGDQNRNGENLELAYTAGRQLTFQDESRQRLEGDELALYQQWLATQRQLQVTAAGGPTTADNSADAVDDASESSSSSEESDTEQQGKALTVSATMNQANRKVVLNDEDLGVNVLIKRKNVHDFFCLNRKDRDRTFPVVIRRRRMDDDYGEPIRHEDYVKAEERLDDEFGNARGQDDGKLGKKRKWAESNDRGAGGKRSDANGMADEVDMLRSSSGFLPDPELDDIEEAEDPSSQGPCKLVAAPKTISMDLRIGYVDFSGIHDRRSLHMLIPLIQPRKLILIAGEEEETLALAEDCKRLLGAGADGEAGSRKISVYTPAVGTWINASVDTNAWVVKLADQLVKGLQWQTVKGVSVATISGQVLRDLAAASGEHREDGSNKRQKTEEPEDSATPAPSQSTALVSANASQPAPPLPILDTAQAGVLSTSIRLGGSQRPLHVGDVRLADLRRGLQSSGHTAEFRGEGTLVVDGIVAVRKGSAGRVEIESWGGPSHAPGMARGRNTFYEIRRMVYDTLAVVGA